jgi:hypothetical protein
VGGGGEALKPVYFSGLNGFPGAQKPLRTLLVETSETISNPLTANHLDMPVPIWFTWIKHGKGEEFMTRKIIAILGSILIACLLLWIVPWLLNGGWPASGPMGDFFPPHIQAVTPEDGQLVKDSYGFCVRYDYRAGSGMEAASQATRYYLDGQNVTKHMYEITELEYPTQIGTPCYRQAEPLAPGWHTAKVTYEDLFGNRFEYKWRFQVIEA